MINELYAYAREREAIRLRRAAGDPPPWTDDPILQRFTFTNVRRNDDRTTRAFDALFYQTSRARPWSLRSRIEILFNCAASRFFGTQEMAAAIGWLRPNIFSLETVKRIARERMDKNQRVYTGAYIIRAQAEPKEISVCDTYLRGILDNGRWLTSCGPTWKDLVGRLITLKGYGPFMAKEVALDAILAGFWETGPTDQHTWTPFGPGAIRGAARILNCYEFRDRKFYLKRRLSDDELLTLCQQILAAAPEHWPVEYGPLDVHDIQWLFCEWDKYQRIKLGEGRSKRTFIPSTEPLPGYDKELSSA